MTSPEELELLALVCRKLIREGDNAVSLDLEKCAFIASRMCGMLVGLSREAGDAGVCLSVILSLNHPLRDVLRVTRLDRMIRVFATIEECERALTPTGIDMPMSRVLVLFSRGSGRPGFAGSGFHDAGKTVAGRERSETTC